MALSKYPVPDNVLRDICEYLGRYGRVKLICEGGELFLVSDDLPLMVEIAGTQAVKPLISATGEPRRLRVMPGLRGHVKQALVKIGYPVEDLAGYVDGESLSTPAPRGHADGDAVHRARLSARGRGRFHAGGARAGRQRVHRAPVRRGQDHRRHGGDGRAAIARRSSSRPTPWRCGSGSTSCSTRPRSPQTRSANIPACRNRSARSP